MGFCSSGGFNLALVKVTLEFFAVIPVMAQEANRSGIYTFARKNSHCS